jgi:hypothetical protein
MARKTFNVAQLVETVNRRNRHSNCTPDVRQGWNSLLEEVLLEAGQYKGYNYLRFDDVAEDVLPGIILNHRGEGEHEFPDETRRFYYL